MKIEINLKIILLAILFLLLNKIDTYVIFILFILIHELFHMIAGITARICSKNNKSKSIGRFNRVLFI